MGDHLRDVNVREPFTELEGVRQPHAPLYGNEHKHALKERSSLHNTRSAAASLAALPSVSLRRWIAALVGLDLLMALIASGIGFLVRFGSGETSQSLQGVPYWLIAAFFVPISAASWLAGDACDRGSSVWAQRNT